MRYMISINEEFKMMCTKSVVWLVLVVHVLVLGSVTNKTAEVKRDIQQFISVSAR
jgi:hypothetical protein